ncbi:MAG TPA: helix-turn-helix transcriptional regulator [Jatrophihabitans sp.]|jgi:transcriptional regulator with XRE-family HTH domain|nr:helix-turn-helix transcriptional regulator [Jatrophihabitans sp.]
MSEARNRGLVASRHLLITQRLRERRDDLGLTQKQIVTRLARCGLQTTNRALSSLEHGSGLDVAKLPELAIALDCTVTYLLGLTDDPHSWLPAESAGGPAGAAAAGVPAVARPAPIGADGSAGHRAAMPDGSAGQSLILGDIFPEHPRRRE